ncbi:MAG: hypothetical protein QM296_07990 [Bacillota bacterium]|nr:hypothetical protein [Bacillota bacterium]
MVMKKRDMKSDKYKVYRISAMSNGTPVEILCIDGAVYVGYPEMCLTVEVAEDVEEEAIRLDFLHDREDGIIINESMVKSFRLTSEYHETKEVNSKPRMT